MKTFIASSNKFMYFYWYQSTEHFRECSEIPRLIYAISFTWEIFEPLLKIASCLNLSYIAFIKCLTHNF